MQQLEKERDRNERLRDELAGFSLMNEENENLEREAAENKIRAEELLAKVDSQARRIKALSKGKKVVTKIKIKKPDMSWAKAIVRNIQKEFRDEIAKGQVEIKTGEDRLTIHLSDTVVFEEDDLEISIDGEEILVRLGEILKKVKNRQIMIGGHLDNTPIAPALAPEFPTPWEFTGTRATEMVRFLEEEIQVESKIMSAVAYGSTRPISTNATEKGRAKNRRMEVVFLP